MKSAMSPNHHYDHAPLQFDRIHVGAYAAPVSLTYWRRKDRLARLRGALLRPEILVLALALTLAALLGASNGFEAVHVLWGWLVGG